MRQISEKILEKAAALSASRGLPKRSDLHITDHYEIDSTKCRILLGFNSQVGLPTTRDVEDYVEFTFGGKVHTRNETMQMHKAESAVSLICTLNTATRPLNDSSSLRRIAGDMFSDDDSGNIWRVVNDGSQKYLMRQTTENISDLVAARRQYHAGRNALSFDKVKTAAPIPFVGDMVKFMSPDNIIMHGEVAKLSDASAVVKANGAEIKVDRQAIIEITDRAKKEVAEKKDILQDYFTKAYGSEEFAKELSSKLSEEEHGLGSTVPAAGKLEKK